MSLQSRLKIGGLLRGIVANSNFFVAARMRESNTRHLKPMSQIGSKSDFFSKSLRVAGSTAVKIRRSEFLLQRVRARYIRRYGATLALKTDRQHWSKPEPLASSNSI